MRILIVEFESLVNAIKHSISKGEIKVNLKKKKEI